MFVDTIVKTHLVDGAIRLHMGTLEPLEGDRGKLRATPGGVIVTTLPGLLRMREQIDALLKKLEGEGVLRKSETTPAVGSGVNVKSSGVHD